MHVGYVILDSYVLDQFHTNIDQNDIKFDRRIHICGW